MKGPRSARFFAACAVIVSLGLPVSRATAGGGGENMLLIVNPNDEASLREANAYAAARAIPDRNIIFIAAPTGVGYKLNTISYTAFTNSYLNTVPAAITSLGLDNQIDYIGTLGTATVVNGSPKNSAGTATSVKSSFNYYMSHLTNFQHGMTFPDATYRASELYQTQVPTGTTATLPYTFGSNAAIHHSTQYTTTNGAPTAPGYNYSQFYLSGNVGYAGTFAITTQQWIDSYARSAAGDGTKPDGTVYYIENDDVRSNTREPYWPAVQKYMTAHGIKWQQIRQPFDGSPNGRPDVRGAIVGSAGYNMPNGSIYLPGSWADSLTSSGSSYGGSGQTKADKFIRAGAAATAGSVTEPFAIADRFTQSMLYIYHNEGSTLGESFFKSVKRPDDMLFEGDLLSQAYADLPRVTMTGFTSGQSVTGTLTLNASATLTSPTVATGIARLELYVDGIDKGSIAAASGAFNLNTTTLSDGRHQVRVVGVNNSQAESEGYTLSYINVNNKGQSVSTGGSSYAAAYNQTIAVPVTAQVGSGGVAVTRVELRSLGRNVGQITGASGSVSLNATLLAYGDNTLIPVAIMADGSQVQGAPIVVSRDFHRLAGSALTPAAAKNPGFTFEYFTGRAGNTLAQTSFAGTADVTTHGTVLSIDPDNTTPANVNMPSQYLTANGGNAGLAIRVTSRFAIATEGEYGFFFTTGDANFESLQLYIDGDLLTSHEFWDGVSKFQKGGAGLTQGGDTLRSEYLMPGEHTFQLLLGNPVADADDALAMIFYYRNTNGDSLAADSSFFYTVVPEPGSSSLFLMIGITSALQRRRTRSSRKTSL